MVLTKSTKDLYEEYTLRMKKIADIKYAAAVLQWDEETYLPAKGASFRGRQLATLSEVAHEWSIDPALGDLLTTLKERGDLDEPGQRNVTLSLEDYTKQKKFTPAFIRLLSETTSRCFHTWIKARGENSFAVFRDDLDRMMQLKKQETELAGYEQHPYNALLDQFEKGATVSLLDKTFDLVRIPPMTWHQFRTKGDEPMGFLCMVNVERDRPQLPSEDDLAAMKADPAIAEFLKG